MTNAFGVNDAGEISVSSFADASDNLHGFLYSKGIFNQVDVPGALDTALYHIPSKGAPISGFFIDQKKEPACT